MTSDKLKPRDFLLEIGCEELPADYLPAALDWEKQGPLLAGGLASAAAGILSGENTIWASVQSFATPRRLVLLIRGLKEKVRKEEKGPPLSVAYDAKGSPTRAAEAFAQRHGVQVSELKRKQIAKGEAVFAEYTVPVTKVLAKAVPEIVKGVIFPKTMRWDDSGVRFGRPIRWLVCLYGKQVVACSFGRVKAGNKTTLTQRSGCQSVQLTSADHYFGILKQARIKLEQGLKVRPGKEPYSHEFDEPDPVKREMLLKMLEAGAKALHGRLPYRTNAEFEWLLNTVTFLAEDPVVQSGVFRKEYLDLPSEVLATAMAKYLKLFSVVSKDEKKLLPKFLAVLEGKPTNPRLVMANYERIIEARFSDARLFYQEDTRAPLSAKVPELQKIVFHEKLGSVHDRIPRMERLMAAIAKGIGLQDPIVQLIPRTAQLAKADLVTQMVREFPSLQGVVGGYYAEREGQPEMIFRAVWEHYRPRVAGDHLPSDPLGSMLALADRLDTLCGYFGIGLKPTGSVDPYGLRRQALGAVRILTEFSFQEKGNMMTGGGLFFRGLSIDRLFDESIQSWGPRLTMEAKALKKELRTFLRERFEWLALPPGGGHRELVAAVLAADDDDLSGAWERLAVLRQMWADPQQKSKLIEAAKVAERTGRMVEAAKEADGLPAVDPQIFTDPLERQLWQSWGEVHPRVEEHLKGRRYAQAVVAYGALYPVIHEFFQRVFVMDENMRLRRNRLSLIHEIFHSLSSTFADLSKLPLSGIA